MNRVAAYTIRYIYAPTKRYAVESHGTVGYVLTQPEPVSSFPFPTNHPEHGPGPFARKIALLGSWWFVVRFRCEAFPPQIP